MISLGSLWIWVEPERKRLKNPLSSKQDSTEIQNALTMGKGNFFKKERISKNEREENKIRFYTN